MAQNKVEVKVSGRFISLKPDGSSDWKWSDTYQVGDAIAGLDFWWIKSISFYPAAAGDRASIRHGATDGPIVFHAMCTSDSDARTKYFDPPMPIAPVFNGDLSACSDTNIYTTMYATTASDCRIVFELA